MMHEVSVTIEPNDKCRRVLGFADQSDGDTPVNSEEWPEEHRDAADAYIEAAEDAPDLGSPADDTQLSWDLFSVSQDADRVSKMATYFHGMSPDEPTDLLRGKLRLLDCDLYACVQIAATAELRG